MNHSKFLPRLTFATLILAFLVVGLGAFVRLSDAGLGCPDWPGCYGHIGVPTAPHQQAHAALHFPDSPVEVAKAWKEMVHRYFAATLGLLIVTIFIITLRQRRERILGALLLAVVCFQGALGMWTVTLLLKPAIVTAHLLGGMATLALLITLYCRLLPLGKRLRVPAAHRGFSAVHGLAALALMAVLAQIALGGWVSSNYAALACEGFPACSGSYTPEVDFEHAFVINRALGQNAEGELLSLASLRAIHWVHRYGALILSVILLMLIRRLFYLHRAWAWSLLGLLSLQIGLGVLNVVLSLPMPIAVAHNLGAAALMTALLLLNFSLPTLFATPAKVDQHDTSLAS